MRRVRREGLRRRLKSKAAVVLLGLLSLFTCPALAGDTARSNAAVALPTNRVAAAAAAPQASSAKTNRVFTLNPQQVRLLRIYQEMNALESRISILRRERERLAALAVVKSEAGQRYDAESGRLKRLRYQTDAAERQIARLKAEAASLEHAGIALPKGMNIRQSVIAPDRNPPHSDRTR